MCIDGTRAWELSRVHNSRWPLDHLFACFDPVTFDLLLFGEQGIVMDYPCAKFGDCTFQLLWFYRADKHTHRITHGRGQSQYSRD